MIGALSTSLQVALCALVALRPPRPRHSEPWNLQFMLGFLINEQPFLGLWWLLSGTTAAWLGPEFTDPLWWLAAGVCVLAALELALIASRARSARPVLSAALEDAFGAGAAPRRTRPSWWRTVLLPFIAWRPDVRRIPNLRYGPARRGHRLDVYISRRTRRTDAPVLVYLHGGGFRMGSKLLGSRSLIYRLAARGWVCVSADYRLLRAGYAEQLADTRAVLAWVNANAATYGGSSDTVFVAGGSAGAHLAATVALSGAEVSGVIALYGYYGDAERPGPEPTSPHAYVHAAAPPFLIVHGALDTLVRREDARLFAERLRAASRQPVAYAELPGTQHNFDQFHSLRFHSVTDAVIRFAELTAGAGSVEGPEQ
ncbi:alpha/beta hydrolase [Peterkaempfera sp. SMS 1(5)a]|uniref:alpha/beta hydrolase n=1 Tax=Peterkaempfera podocarpi TaxID=3232308 RepID=UPI00367176BD